MEVGGWWGGVVGNLHCAPPLTKSSRQCVHHFLFAAAAEKRHFFLSSTALISARAAAAVEVRGENDQLGPPERWLATGGKRSTLQHLSMHSSMIALLRASVSGTGVINGQQRQSWAVWPTLCGLLFYFRGAEVESRSGLFSERGLQRERRKRCRCGVVW